MFNSSLYINFIVEREQEAFQDCIDFLESEGEPDYLQRSDSRLKLYGSVSAGFYHAPTPLVQELDNSGVVVFYPSCHIYTSPDDGSERLSTDLEFVSDICQVIDPIYVYGIHKWQIRSTGEGLPKYHVQSVVSDEGLANNRIDHPTWLMVFPPEMVEAYGREWLLNLPAEQIEELDDGAIMVVATRAFPECESDMDILTMIDDAVKPLEEAFETR